ncbi:MAG: PP2C family protein-serine/threonine phosphatase [Acidobacteriia bacterium]|nr:PP2C family protein-serine/threonine phosphatase [Terriglobia bacterium]
MPTPTSPPAPTSPPNPSHRPGISTQLRQFWHRITEGLELNQLWSQFKSDARASYRLYSRDYKVRRSQDTRKRTGFQVAQEFAWAILEKLSPARRVLLLLALLLLFFGGGDYSWQDRAGHIRVITLPLQFYGGALLFVLLMLEVADRVVMKRDLEIARDIQRWLLPATPPQVPGLAIAFATRAANTVAGDYYDVFARPLSPSGEERFLLAVADVAGKSIPAALLMATFQASLKTLSSTSCSLAELVAGMNQYACTNSQGGVRFTTAFLAEFDAVTRTLTYINAGHNTPVLRRSSGVVERLTEGGLPLGILADATYPSASLTLQKGDWLIIFTDGLVEAVNQRDEDYDEPRMLNVIEAGVTATPEELLRRMMADVDAFVGTTPQHDDITCLVVKVE